MRNDIKISIIGAGNVAWYLAPALARTACVRQIVSRHRSTSEALARRVNDTLLEAGGAPECGAADSLKALLPDSDFYLIATSDDSIAEIAAATPDFPGIWAHTSGSIGIEVFRGLKSRYGSFYPLQTFSKDIAVDLNKVPIFVEGVDDFALEALRNLAAAISPRVYTADSERRRALHIAAVFACNFANQMWVDADRLLRRQGLDITCLLPLLEATLGKLGTLSPAEAMTGPARRGDIKVIRSHIEALPADLREVYIAVSRQILEANHPEIIISNEEKQSEI